MRKRKDIHTILEERLDEIEDLLNDAVSSDEDANVLREIQLRFIFAKTLLTAEISSRQSVAEEGGDEGFDGEEMMRLACMAKRLTELEHAFINQTTGQDNTEPAVEMLQSLGSVGDVVNVETGLVNVPVETSRGSGSVGDVVNVETGSVGSWAECCLNDDDDNAAKRGKDAEELREEFQGFESAVVETVTAKVAATTEVSAVEEEKEDVMVITAAAEEMGRDTDEKKVGFRVLVGFGIMGFVMGMVSFFGYLDGRKRGNVSVTPT